MCGGGGGSGGGAAEMAWANQRAIDRENEARILAQQQAEESRIREQQRAEELRIVMQQQAEEERVRAEQRAQQAAALETQRAEQARRLEEERAAREAATTAQNRAEAEARATRNRTAAMNAARTRTLSELRNRGLNPDEYADLINERLTYQASLLPANADDFTGQFGDPFVEAVTGTIRDTNRRNAVRWFDANTPVGIEDRTFTDTMDDPFVDTVLGRQRSEAVDTVNRAKARGQLNDSGFAGALSRIDELEKAGRATAQSLSNAVVANRRSDFRSLIDRGRATAGSLDLGQTFNSNEWADLVNNKKAELSSSLEGDVYSALNGQQFFDIGDIITKGGAAQGVANPTPAFLDAQAARERLRQTQRNSGQGGTF